MSDDALNYRRHAEKIRRLIGGVSGHAATAGLLLADEYEARADQLEGTPLAAAYIGNIDRVGAKIADERELISTLVMTETQLASQIAAVRQKRLLAEARVEAILNTVLLFDVPPPLRRRSIVPPFEEAMTEAA
ncbi:hypothetical protein KX816_14040 [Sphingosinicellaceae bacterium]|nr:hypothetical protein KX816_14040 [Sphingosinicellaceae bacterium]